MKNIKRYATRFGFIAAMLFALGIASVAPVSADGTIGGTGNLNGAFSTGSVTGSVAFTANVDGTAHNVAGTGSPVINVSDFTAAQTGWYVTASATQFTDGAATNPKTLAADALSITGVTPSDHAGTTHTTATTNTTSYASPIALGATAARIFDADTGSGTGNFDLAPAFSLHVRATDVAASYSNTVTISVVEGQV